MHTPATTLNHLVLCLGHLPATGIQVPSHMIPPHRIALRAGRHVYVCLIERARMTSNLDVLLNDSSRPARDQCMHALVASSEFPDFSPTKACSEPTVGPRSNWLSSVHVRAPTRAEPFLHRRAGVHGREVSPVCRHRRFSTHPTTVRGLKWAEG